MADRKDVVGQTIGPYRVLAKLGEGGMGEVYRARDTRLGRDVAIKILPPGFANNPDRLARFEREARALATLNHPNIAHIHGLEDADGVRAIVMELVEGATLAEMLGRALPLPGALKIARQLADALDAAHEKGIVHRDLKPPNIKITPDGAVKVLDFGLAKAQAITNDDDAATMTVGETREGVILGTAAYMSPEQARGLAVDKRTDIWAFGCVLYEMLTGRPPFGGGTFSDVIAAILEREPDWNLLPPMTPQAIARLLRRCLTKDPNRRLRDFADIRLELDDVEEDDLRTRLPHARETRQSQPRWSTLLVAVGALAAAAGVFWAVSRPREDDALEIRRTTITLPQNQELYTFNSAQPLALSPNGQHIAYVAEDNGSPRLFVRAMRSFDARPVTGSEGARYPFFSPDGRSVAFFAEGKLKRAAIEGGASVEICDAPSVGRGGTWGTDDDIIFDPGAAGLARVAASGGKPEPLTSDSPEIDRGNISWPQLLPDGHGLLATIGSSTYGQIGLFTFVSRRWQILGAGTQAQYLASGHLLYHAAHVQEGELDVVPFDLTTMRLVGPPVAALPSVFRAAGDGGALFAASLTGTLVYAPGGLARTLVRVDRVGRRTPVLQERMGYRFPRVSPDGQKIAVTIDPRPSQIWVFDLGRTPGVRLTAGGHSIIPLWTPDGRRVTYFANGDLSWRDAEGAGPAERLLERPNAQYPMGWTADGRLIFDDNAQMQSVKSDVAVMRLNESPQIVLGSAAAEYLSALSLDGRWLAYTSDESGRREVYVRPFPNVSDRKWAISSAGGHSPVWARDGRELFYMNGTAVMAVAVNVGQAGFGAGSPTQLFAGPFDTTQDHNFDVFPDRQSFVMVEADPDSRPTRIQVVDNWFRELSARQSTP